MKERLKDFFSRDRKTLYIILSIVLISIFSLTIVYAALSVTLNITGNAEVVASTWDIHLDNVKVTSGSVSGTTPSITSPTTATFSTSLTTPGDFYEFTIDVVNDGTIDAMIDSVTKEPTLTETQAKYLNYIIEYENGESINTKQLVSKNSYVRLKVKVEFRKDITASDLPTTSETLNLAFTVNYVQSDGTGSDVSDNGIAAKVVSANGDINDIGTIVTIGSEQFYTIGTDENNVKLLSMYNLYVGNEAYGEDDNGPLIRPLSQPTVKQDSSAKGVTTGLPFVGVTAFSNDSQKGINYGDYNGSIVEIYVNDYQRIIEEFGVIVEKARLITHDELADTNTFNCEDNKFCLTDKYTWIYSTSYWCEGYSADQIWSLMSNGIFSVRNYDLGYYFGVRPVIVISKDYF